MVEGSTEKKKSRRPVYKIPPSRTPTMPRTKAVEQSKSNIIVREETIAPISNEASFYDLNSVTPSMNNELITQYDNNVSAPISSTEANYENSDINIPTSITDFKENNDDAPTNTPDELQETFTTIETFDSPIQNEEASVVEEEMTIEETSNQSEIEKSSDDEEGKGSRGGKDAEADEDMTGDDGANESEGNADERGQYQLETKGEFAGKKVFELKQNGNIGFEPEHLSVAGLKNFMISGITLLLLAGALLFAVGSDDKKQNNNYF